MSLRRRVMGTSGSSSNLLVSLTTTEEVSSIDIPLEENAQGFDFFRVIAKNIILSTESLVRFGVNGYLTSDFYGNNSKVKVDLDVGVAKAIGPNSSLVNTTAWAYRTGGMVSHLKVDPHVSEINIRPFRDSTTIKPGVTVEVYGYKY